MFKRSYTQIAFICNITSLFNPVLKLSAFPIWVPVHDGPQGDRNLRTVLLLPSI